jgi:hypothetical protein
MSLRGQNRFAAGITAALLVVGTPTPLSAGPLGLLGAVFLSSGASSFSLDAVGPSKPLLSHPFPAQLRKALS